ncbi:MAG: PadR family transcriptional regulator [Acidimicrobiia bacterium]|nr:PadR family transcriptional regulator [Acidimicrobiia bacterium]
MTTTNSSEVSQTAPSVLPRRFLRQLLFLGLSRSDRSYGYELAEAVRSYGLNIDMAGVYRELRSMEQKDLLTSSWESSDNGPDRRVYMVTPLGSDALATAVAELRLARDQLSAALEDADTP